ncbi:MAG: methionine--tRNA ligase [Acidobacteriota bacterium]|nr:methionine--tRNA ligase [Acidobacteriota bacterium]
MKKKKLITSALPYVNNVPHLGNIIGCVLSADVYARFCRSRGYETLYICGTDEYGTATENKAREEGMTPREVCDKYHAIHAEIYRDFEISFDAFGRTSDPEQTDVAQEIFHDLDANGLISEHTSQRTYCEHDQMFLADRFVEGVCPKCGYEDARGDQCDNCGSLLDPESLINPHCKICKNPPVRRETTHLHLGLDKLQPRLQAWFDRSSTEGRWTRNAVTTTGGWLDRGLEARAITRDLKWGVPVPKQGFEGKVFYVWYDAPIGYISITAHHFDNWRDWWQKPDEVDLYQFMAKDNIPFHTIMFPASLIGSGRPWTLLHHINSTEYLNYEDTKFSKSRGIGVFGHDVRETGIHTDLWRFYLLLVRPENNDSAFNWAEFFERVNSDFLNNIGNLVNRTLVFLHKNFEGRIRDLPLPEEHQGFVTQVRAQLDKATAVLEEVKLRDGLREVLAAGAIGNKFFQDMKPWEKVKGDETDVAHAHATVSVLAYLVRSLAVALEPYMPATSARILGFLQLEDQTWEQVGRFEGLDGHAIRKPEILYPKMDPKFAEKLRKKFSGDAPQFGKFRIVVGEILSTRQHTDTLYVMSVDVGEETPRSIVAGLAKTYTQEQLQGRKVMVLANLAAAEISGQNSQGMVLVCRKRKKKDELLDGSPFKVGDVVEVDDQKVDHAEITIDVFKGAPFSVKDYQVLFDDQACRIGDQPLRTVELAGGKIR